MAMELDDCITKDCSTIYRFQFASIAFICGVYLPFTFHSNIWSLYAQPFKPVNCTAVNNALLFGSMNNLTARPWSPKTQNRSECCTCNGLLNGTIGDKRLLALCQEWMGSLNDLDARKATIVDEWHLTCGRENHKSVMLGSISFYIAEILGALIIGFLADQYGRKLLLLMCLYLPVLFGSLAAFTTTYSLFLILRWPVGFLNRGLLLLGFIMVLESCEYTHRAQIGCLLLASMPIFGIIIGVTYFFILDWRHMQLLGTLITTLTLCYPWLIPESRRWYLNSHRVSRVNKLLQLCSTKQSSSMALNKVGSPAPAAVIYDKPNVPEESKRTVTSSALSLIIEEQMRTITCCLFILWFITSFCYQCTFFPPILPHPTMNYVLMNAIEFFSFILALIVAYKIGRRPPLAVLTLISGLSSVSLAITLLGTGHVWLEITFSLLARACLRTCYALLILFTAELYPTSVRATGLAIALAGEVIPKILVEILFYYSIDRTLLLFISGGVLCLSCCLIFPLPETILYDLPDSVSDLQSMGRSLSSETEDQILPTSSQHYMFDSNTIAVPREPRPSTAVSAVALNDLSSPPQQHVATPKAILRSQQQQTPAATAGPKMVTIHSQPEIIQLQSNTSSLDALSNPCYFTAMNDTIDQYDIEQHQDNRVVISIRGGDHGTTNNNNNNNNCNEDHQSEVTQF